MLKGLGEAVDADAVKEIKAFLAKEIKSSYDRTISYNQGMLDKIDPALEKITSHYEKLKSGNIGDIEFQGIVLAFELVQNGDVVLNSNDERYDALRRFLSVKVEQCLSTM